MSEAGGELHWSVRLPVDFLAFWERLQNKNWVDADRALFYEAEQFLEFFKLIRATAYLKHFLSASGTPIYFEFAQLFNEDTKVRKIFSQKVGEALRTHRTAGTVSIPQNGYANWDWAFSLGSLLIHWYAAPSAGASDRPADPLGKRALGKTWIDPGTNARTRNRANPTWGRSPAQLVRVWGTKEYHWHKILDWGKHTVDDGSGKEDVRADAALHQAGYDLDRGGYAKFFPMIGLPCGIDAATGRPFGQMAVSGAQPK